MQIISASIDLSKIDKSRIVIGKNGGKFFNIQIFVNDQADQYGNDVSIQVNQTKEERESGVPRVYLGNGKTVHRTPNPTTGPVEGATLPTRPSAAPAASQSDDDLPF